MPEENLIIEKIKTCPYCFAKIPIDAKRCDICKKKIGKINKFGLAEEPIDWFSYIMAIIACGSFIYFLYWLFFLKTK